MIIMQMLLVVNINFYFSCRRKLLISPTYSVSNRHDCT